MLRPFVVLFALGLSAGGAWAQARFEIAPTRGAFSVVQPSGKPFASAPTPGMAKQAAPRTARGVSPGAVFHGPASDSAPPPQQASQGQAGQNAPRQTAAAPPQRPPQAPGRAAPAAAAPDDQGDQPTENGQQPQENGAQPGETPEPGETQEPANSDAPAEGNTEQ